MQVNRMEVGKIVKAKQGAVVDVRTPVEFKAGHAPGAVNIPLNEIPKRLQELKGMQLPLILCCASGSRSWHATQFLLQSEVDCINAGPWTNVVQMMNQ